jgi:hypothetical protein
MMDNWPFKYFNGVQTPESLALQSDKDKHEPTEIDLNDFDEALL